MSNSILEFRIRRTQFSDNSSVFAVCISHDEGELRLDAVTEAAAVALQKKIWEAIKTHTIEKVEFIEEGF